jgi:hypothetical protein
MEQRTSWEANGHSTSREIPHLLWNLKVYYRGHKNQPLIPVLSQMNPVYSLLPDFCKFHSNIILPSSLRSHFPLHSVLPSPRPCSSFRNMLDFTSTAVSPHPVPQPGGLPLADCPRLLIQYIRSCPPHLELVSVFTLRRHHAVVTGTPLAVRTSNAKLMVFRYFDACCTFLRMCWSVSFEICHKNGQLLREICATCSLIMFY